ncbi:nitroreductase [Methanococcus vannielii SB]|uniref:Nitroreductase n=1 Tax=Methanococcus vannielii (strain ATCC 35089 / DSM 1224 / JCM 13029 / OCM 148 / SB) TaxID=406327 RepID=A6UR98_METVS|nr:nitroreductase family protein [Methanococcus vannielii]ABR55020.1 nitroreductase [Methanococcus vannielii SB]
MNAIFERRSIRHYTLEDVSEELIDDLLLAAMSAPSACDQRPWDFVVIRNKETLLGISKVNPHAKMLNEAPVSIAVCGNMKRVNGDCKQFWVQDCAAATENILLEAQDKGLGAVWLGFYPVEERVEKMRKIIHAPDNIVPFSVVAIGHPAEKPVPVEKFDKERIHYEKWQIGYY